MAGNSCTVGFSNSIFSLLKKTKRISIFLVMSSILEKKLQEHVINTRTQFSLEWLLTVFSSFINLVAFTAHVFFNL